MNINLSSWLSTWEACPSFGGMLCPSVALAKEGSNEYYGGEINTHLFTCKNIKICQNSNMSLEGKPEKFNIEKFKEDFELALQKFADNIELASDNRDRFDEDDERGDDERNEDHRIYWKNIYNTELEKLLPVALDALKKADNKQEVFDEISKIFWEVELKNTTGSYPEDFESPISVKNKADLFERVILNLLKSN